MVNWTSCQPCDLGYYKETVDLESCTSCTTLAMMEADFTVTTKYRGSTDSSNCIPVSTEWQYYYSMYQFACSFHGQY